MRHNIIINPNWCSTCQNWNGKMGGGCTLPEDEGCSNLEVWPPVFEKKQDIKDAVRFGRELSRNLKKNHGDKR